VPLLGLGIPGSNSAAILLGGFLIHGLTPGPALFTKAPEIVYALYAGLFVANIAMVLIGLVILTPCLWLVNRPKPYLIAFVLALVMSGVYAIEQSTFDLGIVLAAGLLGYMMRRLHFPTLPLVLGVVLGFMVESNYRRSLVISRGNHMIFLEDTVSLVLLVLTAALLTYSIVSELRSARKAGNEIE
jgi:putative tricarboxylic transport membrane protein